jgi:hypothetical protein
MNPYTLTFQRTIRRGGDVTISFVPRSDPSREERVYQRAHIVLLSDLFLVCEHVSTEQRAKGESADGADMWLVFPPLAGKHLRTTMTSTDPPGVVERDSDRTLQVLVMKRETLTIRCQSRAERDAWKDAFDECTAFGNSRMFRCLGSIISVEAEGTKRNIDRVTEGPN